MSIFILLGLAWILMLTHPPVVVSVVFSVVSGALAWVGEGALFGALIISGIAFVFGLVYFGLLERLSNTIFAWWLTLAGGALFWVSWPVLLVDP